MDRYPVAAEQEGRASDKRALGMKKQQVLELLATGGLEALRSAPPDLQGLPACEALLERSWALRYQDQVQMVQLALAAVLVADRMTYVELGFKELLNLRCRAWTELANAWRVNDDLDQAEEAVGRAAELFVCDQDPLLGARLFTVLASLYGARRLLHVSLTTFDVAVEIYRRHGDGHLVGRTLITKGIFTGYQGDAEEAIRLIQEGLSSVDERRDPWLVFSSMQCQAWLLVDCGRFVDAQIALWKLRRCQHDIGGQLNELKLRWLEAHILAGRGKLGPAEEVLREVKQGFEGAELPYKAALAGLELGAVWLRQGRTTEAEKVVLECTEVFLSRRIQRETLAAVLVLQKSAEKKLLTLEVLNAVIERLRREERER